MKLSQKEKRRNVILAALAVELRAEGHTFAKIAELMNNERSHDWVFRVIKRHEEEHGAIIMRPLSEKELHEEISAAKRTFKID